MIADRTYHGTKDGRAVEETDDAGTFLLIAKGQPIPDDMALQYGIPFDFAPQKALRVRNKALRVRNKAITPENK